MDLHVKQCSFSPLHVKCITIDLKTPMKKPSFYTSPQCMKLTTPRKLMTKSNIRPREQLHPSKTLLPSHGLIKLTALPEELKDPLHVFPATQLNGVRRYQQFTTSLSNTNRKTSSNSRLSQKYAWVYGQSWVPLASFSNKRQMTASDLLSATDRLIKNKDLNDVKNQFSSHSSYQNPMNTLEKEITRSSLIDIRHEFQRCKTQY